MKYPSPLIKGRFIRRYKRFFADVEIEGRVVTAHVPNTGSLKTCLEDNAVCYLTHHSNPQRKLSWTLERIVVNGQKIGLNTRTPNALVYEAWEKNRISHWTNFDRIQKEVKINEHSRLDLTLWSSKDHPHLKTLKALKTFPSPLHFVEIKNVTMADFERPKKNSKTPKTPWTGTGLFPDAQTSRGVKHIQELINLIDQGHTGEMVYTIQREDVHSFNIARQIDPLYYKTLQEGLSKGLLVTPLKVEFKAQETWVTGEVLPFNS